MHSKADELLRRQVLLLALIKGGDALEDGAGPTRELTRRVDIVALDLRGEVRLGLLVHVDHRLGEVVGDGAELDVLDQQSAAIRFVNGDERLVRREVDEEDGGPAKESVAERDTAGVGRGVAGADELDVVEGDPRVVLGAVVASALSELAEELHDALGAIFIGGGEVDLIAEDNELLARGRGEDEAVLGVLHLAVLIKDLRDGVGGGAAGEVKEGGLVLRGGTEDSGERHSLTGAGRAAEDDGLASADPRGDDVLVAGCIDGGNDNIVGTNLGSGDLRLDDAGADLRPLAVLDACLVVEQRAGGDVGLELLRELLAAHRLELRGKAPQQRLHHLAANEALEDLWGLLLVRRVGVLTDHEGTVGEEREESAEGLGAVKLHDAVLRVLLLEGVEGPLNEAAGPKVLLSRVHYLVLNLDGRHLLVGELGAVGLALVTALVAAGLGSGGALGKGERGLVLTQEGAAAEVADAVVENVAGRNSLLAEPHHTAAGDGGGGGVAEVLHLKHDAHIRGQREALAVGKREQLVVVEEGVEVLDPLRIDVAVEENPMALFGLVVALHIVDDTAEGRREHAVLPLASRRVEDTIELALREGLRVNNVRVAVNVLHLRQGLEEGRPRGGLTAAGGADEHDTVVDGEDLVQLDNLGNPQVASRVARGEGNVVDGLLEVVEGDLLWRAAGEHIAEQRVEQINIVGDELWNNRLGERLHHEAHLILLG